MANLYKEEIQMFVGQTQLISLNGNNQGELNLTGSTLEDIEKKRKEELIGPSLVKKTKIDEDLGKQEQKVEEIALPLITKQEAFFPFLFLAKELIFSIFKYLPKNDLRSCMTVCKAFKLYLENIRNIENKDILKSWFKNNAFLIGMFNCIGIIENLNTVPISITRKNSHFEISRDKETCFLNLELNNKRPLPSQQLAKINSIIDEMNTEETKKKELAKPSDKLYALLNAHPDNTLPIYFDEADHVEAIHHLPPQAAKQLSQCQLKRDNKGIWNIDSIHPINGLRPQQKKILELTTNKLNAEIKAQLEFAQDVFDPLLRGNKREIWGRFNTSGLLEIIDTKIDQDYKNTFQFKIIKNELEVWELILKNVQAPLTPSQEIILDIIRINFNEEEIIDKEVGVWEEIQLKPKEEVTERELLFLEEYSKIS